MLAGIIDLFILGGAFIVTAFLFGTKALSETTSTVTNQAGQIVESTKGIYATLAITGLPGVIFYLAVFSYFVFLEWLLAGTIGKLAMGLRVVSMDGSKIGFGKSLKRNLLRIIDGFPFIFVPYLLGLIILATNDRKQRLGDKIAKTLVIKP